MVFKLPSLVTQTGNAKYLHTDAGVYLNNKARVWFRNWRRTSGHRRSFGMNAELDSRGPGILDKRDRSIPMVCTLSCPNTMHIRALTCLANLTQDILSWPPKLELHRMVFLVIKALLKWTYSTKKVIFIL